MQKSKILFLLADIILVSLSVLLAFLIRFEGQIPNRYFINIQGIILLALLITLPIFYFLKLYAFSWVYVSLAELISLTKATILSFLLLTAFYFIFRDHPIFSGFPRSTLFITYFFIFVLCGGIRFSKRVYLQIFSKGKTEFKEKTLIVGAGDAGEEILRNILATKKSPYFPIGFVDDEPQKQGVVIHGIKVLGKIDEIPEIVKSENIEAMIIALPSAGAKVIKKTVEMGRKANLRRIKIVPSLSEIMDGRVSVGNLREIEVEDLLEREPIQFDEKSIENFIYQKSVLITGAAGSIGSELSRQVAKFFPALLLLLDQDETGIFNISEELKTKFPKLNIYSFVGDILDKNKIERIFEKFKPKIVFHAAAYKHVPLMELEPEEAVKTNIFGTKIVAEAA